MHKEENKKPLKINGFFVCYGGGGGNRTPVRKPSASRSTYLVRLFGFNPHTPTGQACSGRSAKLSGRTTRRGESVVNVNDAAVSYPTRPINKPVQRSRSLRLREQNARRWRLCFFSWIYEVTEPRYALSRFATHVEAKVAPMCPAAAALPACSSTHWQFFILARHGSNGRGHAPIFQNLKVFMASSQFWPSNSRISICPATSWKLSRQCRLMLTLSGAARGLLNG